MSDMASPMDIASGIPTLPLSTVDSSSSSHSDSTNSSDSSIDQDDDMLLLVIMALHLYVTLLNLFEPIELSRENQILVNVALPLNDMLSRLGANPTQFKELTKFMVDEVIELCY